MRSIGFYYLLSILLLMLNQTAPVFGTGDDKLIEKKSTQKADKNEKSKSPKKKKKIAKEDPAPQIELPPIPKNDEVNPKPKKVKSPTAPTTDVPIETSTAIPSWWREYIEKSILELEGNFNSTYIDVTDPQTNTSLTIVPTLNPSARVAWRYLTGQYSEMFFSGGMRYFAVSSVYDVGLSTQSIYLPNISMGLRYKFAEYQEFFPSLRKLSTKLTLGLEKTPFLRGKDGEYGIVFDSIYVPYVGADLFLIYWAQPIWMLGVQGGLSTYLPMKSVSFETEINYQYRLRPYFVWKRSVDYTIELGFKIVATDENMNDLKQAQYDIGFDLCYYTPLIRFLE